MGGVAELGNSKWWSERVKAHIDKAMGGSATCFALAVLCGSALLVREFER
jgi:hypothetical protein